MDIISLNEAATANGRIEKVIAQPDSVSGLVTMPSVVATGEVISIPSGRTVVHPNLKVDGTLDLQGTLFIPSGGSVSTTEVDATVVKQNGNVVANDSAVVHKTGNETIAGVKNFSSSPLLPVPTLVNQAISMGNIIEKTGASIGYGTGSGGTVTQLTSKSTTVTLNKPSGQITMNSASLAGGASVTFALNNNLLSSNDTLTFTMEWNLTTGYRFEQAAVGVGTTLIRVTNISGVALSEAVQVKFNMTKGALS